MNAACSGYDEEVQWFLRKTGSSDAAERSSVSPIQPMGRRSTLGLTCGSGLWSASSWRQE